MEELQQAQAAPERSRPHSKKKRHKARRRRRLWRIFWIGATAISASASYFLFLFDSQLRRPATDYSDGDPPTKFMVLAIASGILALLCFLASIFAGRTSDPWDVR